MLKSSKLIKTAGVSALAIMALSAGLYVANSLKYDFKTLDGEQYSLSDLKGQTLVINYFAQWCAPCLREIPELNEFYHQAPESVRLFAVSYDNLSEQELTSLKQKYNIEFPIISQVEQPFPFERPQYLPATFIIKPSGELAGQMLGEQTVKTLTEATMALK